MILLQTGTPAAVDYVLIASVISLAGMVVGPILVQRLKAGANGSKGSQGTPELAQTVEALKEMVAAYIEVEKTLRAERRQQRAEDLQMAAAIEQRATEQHTAIVKAIQEGQRALVGVLDAIAPRQPAGERRRR